MCMRARVKLITVYILIHIVCVRLDSYCSALFATGEELKKFPLLLYTFGLIKVYSLHTGNQCIINKQAKLIANAH